MVTSAGILLYRVVDGETQVLLGHPGGPFFAKKDAGVWSILKGEADLDEDLLVVAKREFLEETGHAAPPGEALSLGEIIQRGGKRVVAWALEGDLDPSEATSNTFEMEWPPRSGRIGTFPEIDRVAWFDTIGARTKINAAQASFLDRLEAGLTTAP
jgi:predicted NUDIX family NTP pyrophosphohydrolase